MPDALSPQEVASRLSTLAHHGAYPTRASVNGKELTTKQIVDTINEQAKRIRELCKVVKQKEKRIARQRIAAQVHNKTMSRRNAYIQKLEHELRYGKQ